MGLISPSDYLACHNSNYELAGHNLDKSAN